MGVIALVLTVSALASGLVDRSPLSFPMMFLGLGFLLGRGGLGAIDIGPHSLLGSCRHFDLSPSVIP